MSLPDRLQSAVAAWLAARKATGSLRKQSAALSATYRAGGTSGEIDLGSYLVARLPATYAAVSRVLSELALRRPAFAPRSVLDAGSGPGTASWAASEIWPELARVTFLDNSSAFLRLAQDLGGSGGQALATAAAVEGSLSRVGPDQMSDLVIAAYALAELPVAEAAAAAAALWRAAGSVLVILEPGTPQGFARIRLARERLLAEGAVPVAPCPHGLACPVVGKDWCHFSVRLARSRAHMHAKAASVPFEDERFSCLVMARDGEATGGGRILSPRQLAKPGITFRLCTQGRIEERHVARRDAAAYKPVRKLDWGDLMAPATEEPLP